MTEDARLSIQDRDILGRLTQYFDSFQLRLREGEGWLILNAGRARGGRLARFISERTAEYRPLFSSYFLLWRDFALNSYMVNVELPERDPAQVADARLQHEYRIADRVSKDMQYHMLFSDLFVLSGVQPAHPHEALQLDRVFAERQTRRLATILITPRSLDSLAADFRMADQSGRLWDRFYERVYATSLIAL
jgi:hypothetical protein